LAAVGGDKASYVPSGPVLERCSSNPVSLGVLSAQLTLIWLADTGAAPASEGGVLALNDTSVEGASGWLRSQATAERTRSELHRQKRRTASIGSSGWFMPAGDRR